MPKPGIEQAALDDSAYTDRLLLNFVLNSYTIMTNEYIKCIRIKLIINSCVLQLLHEVCISFVNLSIIITELLN